MKSNHLVLLSFISASIFWSCSEQKEEVSQKTVANYSWEIQDSVDLEILGNPMLADASSDGSNILFYDFAAKELIITNGEGKIQTQFSKTKDTPDAYGFMMEVPGFHQTNQLVVVGMNGIFIYDLQGKMIQKLAHPESLSGAGFMGIPGKHTVSTKLNGKDYLLTKSVRMHDSFAGELKFYDSFRALELINPETKEISEIVPFEKGSMFLNGTGYFESDYAPAFASKNEKLYVCLGAEQKLSIYNLSENGAELDTIISFSIPEFKELEPKELAEFKEGTVSINGGTPAIRNIHLIDGKILLHYYPGHDPEVFSELGSLWNQGKSKEAEEMYAKAESEINQGVLIIDQNTLEIEQNLLFPEGVNKEGFVSANGYLWMEKAKSKEEEEDFLRIYKIKLVDK